MKGLDSRPAAAMGDAAPGAAPGRPAPGDDIPARLAEAIEILADRARRHGLVEVVHLLEVAALAARDLPAAPMLDGHNRNKRKRGRPRAPQA